MIIYEYMAHHSLDTQARALLGPPFKHSICVCSTYQPLWLQQPAARGDETVKN